MPYTTENKVKYKGKGFDNAAKTRRNSRKRMQQSVSQNLTRFCTSIAICHDGRNRQEDLGPGTIRVSAMESAMNFKASLQNGKIVSDGMPEAIWMDYNTIHWVDHVVGPGGEGQQKRKLKAELSIGTGDDECVFEILPKLTRRHYKAATIMQVNPSKSEDTLKQDPSSGRKILSEPLMQSRTEANKPKRRQHPVSPERVDMTRQNLAGGDQVFREDRPTKEVVNTKDQNRPRLFLTRSIQPGNRDGENDLYPKTDPNQSPEKYSTFSFSSSSSSLECILNDIERATNDYKNKFNAVDEDTCVKTRVSNQYSENDRIQRHPSLNECFEPPNRCTRTISGVIRDNNLLDQKDVSPVALPYKESDRCQRQSSSNECFEPNRCKRTISGVIHDSIVDRNDVAPIPPVNGFDKPGAFHRYSCSCQKPQQQLKATNENVMRHDFFSGEPVAVPETTIQANGISLKTHDMNTCKTCQPLFRNSSSSPPVKDQLDYRRPSLLTHFDASDDIGVIKPSGDGCASSPIVTKNAFQPISHANVNDFFAEFSNSGKLEVQFANAKCDHVNSDNGGGGGGGDEVRDATTNTVGRNISYCSIPETEVAEEEFMDARDDDDVYYYHSPDESESFWGHLVCLVDLRDFNRSVIDILGSLMNILFQ